jgi:hypothetical protein
MHRGTWSSIRKTVKNGSYACSIEDAYSRVLSLTHHIEKLEVCMHRDRWSSIGKAVKNGNYTNSGLDAYRRVFSLTHHIEKLEVCTVCTEIDGLVLERL